MVWASGCSLWVGSESLSHVEELKYLCKQIVRLQVQALCRTVLVKREPSWTAKITIYQLIYIPTLTCRHEL